MRANLAPARAYASAVAAGDDPYRAATGMMVKAYRADWDGTLQPYALYVPRDYKPGRPGGWPLIVALHGAYSDHRHNLRRVFGLDNRPRENDAEASRNELPLPDVPALVVSPFGRGELMGYDGLGGDDVMRVIADVRRAYDVDPDRISLTGLSMGGGGTWQIGPPPPGAVRGAGARLRGRGLPPDGPARRTPRFYDLDGARRAIARARWPPTPRACRSSSFTAPRTRRCPSPTRARWSSGSASSAVLGKNVRYTEYPDVGHNAWIPAYKDATLLRTLAAIKRDPAAPKARRCRRRRGCAAMPGPVRQERSAAAAAPLRLRHARRARRGRRRSQRSRTRWPTGGRWSARSFTVKADAEVTADDRARFSLVLVGAAPLNSLPPSRRAAPTRAARRPRLPRARARPARGRARCTLVLGALTPRGFDRLKRFARPNRDGWAPEPNRPFVLLAD